MDGNEPPGTRIIHVQSSNVNKVEGIIPLSTGKNDNAVSQRIILDNDKTIVKVFPFKPATQNTRKAQTKNSFREVEITFSNHIKDMVSAKESKENNAKVELCKVKAENAESKLEKGNKKKKGRKNKSSVMPYDDKKEKHDGDGQVETGSQSKLKAGVDGKKKKKAIKRKKKHDVDGQVDDNAGSDPKVNVGTYGTEKKKEAKTKEKKKINKSKTKVKDEVIKEPLSDAEEKIEAAATGNANNRRKLPCVFGFIATWLAKRKEKRRDKKRKAIAARAAAQRLVEYGHKTTRGGEAFTIEVDNRPSFGKPLLPPIKQNPGPIRRERYQNAVCRRAENLAQRKDAAGEYEKKKIKCNDRKAENDYQFRQKAHLSIRQKQANAERNRDIISRCKSRLRAPIAMSPSQHSDNGFTRQPSAASSVWSNHGPSCYSEEDDRDDWKFDMDIF